MKLSVCFPTYGEPENALNTVISIRETTKDHPVEIVVIDDSGGRTSPVSIPDSLGAIVHRNTFRIGSGPSRHVAAQIATGDVLLVCDSHMLFSSDWYSKAAEHIFDRPKTVHCGSMVALDPAHPTLNNHNGHYYGAKFEFCRNKKVLEGVWTPDKPGDDYPLQCVMGACYFVPRQWYLKLSPHAYLRSFGHEEEMLSIKSWMAGGDVRMLRNVKIGHKFRAARERAAFDIKTSHKIYNQLFLLHTCLPETLVKECLNHFQKTVDFRQAIGMIEADWHLIEAERIRNAQTFTRSFDWIRSEFGI